MLKYIAILSLISCSAAAHAQTYNGIQERNSISYRTSTEFSSACRTDIATGASLWNTSGANIAFSNAGTYSTRVGRTKTSTTSVEPGPLIPEVPANAAAFTDREYTTYDYSKSLWKFRNFNIIFNETMIASGNFYCGPVSKTGQGATPANTLYLLDVVSHEFGHGIGLDHDNAVYPTMMYSPNYTTYAIRYLSSRDKNGAITLMGPK